MYVLRCDDNGVDDDDNDGVMMMIILANTTIELNTTHENWGHVLDFILSSSTVHSWMLLW